MSQDLYRDLSFGFLVQDVYRMHYSIVDRALESLGVTRSQWWLLYFLSRRDGLSQVSLANELEIGKVAIGGLVDRLEASNLVERRSDAIDRRVKRIYLTDEGNKLTIRIRQSVAEVEKVIFDGIEDADFQTALRLLRSMKVNLHRLLDESRAIFQESPPKHQDLQKNPVGDKEDSPLPLPTEQY